MSRNPQRGHGAAYKPDKRLEQEESELERRQQDTRNVILAASSYPVRQTFRYNGRRYIKVGQNAVELLPDNDSDPNGEPRSVVERPPAGSRSYHPQNPSRAPSYETNAPRYSQAAVVSNTTDSTRPPQHGQKGAQNRPESSLLQTSLVYRPGTAREYGNPISAGTGATSNQSRPSNPTRVSGTLGDSVLSRESGHNSGNPPERGSRQPRESVRDSRPRWGSTIARETVHDRAGTIDIPDPMENRLMGTNHPARPSQPVAEGQARRDTSVVTGRALQHDQDRDEYDEAYDACCVLRGRSAEFAMIPENDFRQRAIFLRACPELLSTSLPLFLQEAVGQFNSNNEEAAVKAMGCLVILNLCQKFKNKPNIRDPMYDAVKNMGNSGTRENMEFTEIYKNVYSTVIATVNKPEPAPPTDQKKRSNTNPDLASLGGMTNAERYGKVKPIKSKEMERFEQHELQKEPSYKKLSDRYRTPKTGKYFERGLVFSMLWHESVGEETDPRKTEQDKVSRNDTLPHNTVRGPFGELILTHIRRFVVIRNRDGYCWCLSINSYGNRGIAKRGLTEKEQQAHTIIHDSKEKPQRLQNEPAMSKKPIPVIMERYETLIPASRLHYGKPYCVEWNTRVMKIGRIEPDHLPVVIADAHNELLENPEG